MTELRLSDIEFTCAHALNLIRATPNVKDYDFQLMDDEDWGTMNITMMKELLVLIKERKKRKKMISSIDFRSKIPIDIGYPYEPAVKKQKWEEDPVEQDAEGKQGEKEVKAKEANKDEKENKNDIEQQPSSSSSKHHDDDDNKIPTSVIDTLVTLVADMIDGMTTISPNHPHIRDLLICYPSLRLPPCPVPLLHRCEIQFADMFTERAPRDYFYLALTLGEVEVWPNGIEPKPLAQ